MDAELLEILRCPHSRAPLRAMTPAELDATGARVGQRWQAGLTTDDGAYAYPILDGIVGLLPGLAIARERPDTELRQEKQDVQRFYDEIGWQRGEDGDFADATLFEDLRPVTREYIRACHRRVDEQLRRPGRFLLDVASGPVQYDDYLAYAEGYERRLCVDLSMSALRAARRRLGERGCYVLGDITRLPLADGSVDGVVSLHTIYHVPADEQEAAFRELYRVLRPGKTGVVVYSWRDALLTRVLLAPALPVRAAARLLRRLRGQAPALYFHPHPHAWFARKAWPFPVRVLSWRSLGILPMRAFVHPWLGGRALLRGVYALEERFPELMGKIGEYPLIVLEKAA